MNKLLTRTFTLRLAILFLSLCSIKTTVFSQTTESKVDYLEDIYFSGLNKEGLNTKIQTTLSLLEANKASTTSQAIQYAFLSGIKDKASAADKACDVEDMLAAGIYTIDQNEAKAQGIGAPSSKTTANIGSVLSSTQSISNSAYNLAWDSWALSNGSINSFGRASTLAGGAYKLGVGAGAAGEAYNAIQQGKQIGKSLGLFKDKPCSSVPTKTITLSDHIPQTSTAGNGGGTDDAGQQNNTSTSASNATPVSTTAYQNYDFRAGNKIIFEDDFATDADGEFPAHWDLGKGQAVVNKITGIPAFLLTDGNYCQVSPRITNKSYLTDNFSVEYDTYMTEGAYGLIIYMYDAEGSNNISVKIDAEAMTYNNSVTNNNLEGSLPSVIQYANFKNKWHHIAIAYKNDQMKVYVDQYRVLVVPHCDFKPTHLDCEGIGNQNDPIIFKDFKIADGASMNMLDKIMTDGKFVTHSINFDVNKSIIKPESMGVINDIVKYMQANASLKLEVDGHTDSDGADAANLTLSQQRADAVKAAMVAAGIDASRLTTKGYGETKPLGTNDTPEGKAMNRRVEFIKM